MTQAWSKGKQAAAWKKGAFGSSLRGFTIGQSHPRWQGRLGDLQTEGSQNL